MEEKQYTPYTPGELPPPAELIAIAEEAKEFTATRQAEGLVILNYHHIGSDPEQFRWPRSEMRGLAICGNRVAARPFQKFWNWGEPRAAAASAPWNGPHEITDKLDGSLCFPARTKKGRRWLTRNGLTTMAERTETWLKADANRQRLIERLLEELSQDRDGAACTPLFENWTPADRIVVNYGTPRLTLLAVRRNEDGQYWSYERMQEAYSAIRSGQPPCPEIRIVQPIASAADTTTREGRKRLVEEISRWEGNREGIVIAFPSGHRIKVKSHAYLALHRARSEYSSETRMAHIVLAGTTSQLVDALAQDTARARRVRKYEQQLLERFNENVTRIAERIEKLASEHKTRKEIAQAWRRLEWTRCRQAVGFRHLTLCERCEQPLKETLAAARRTAAEHCLSQRRFEEKVLPLLGPEPPRWSPPDGDGERESTTAP